MALRAEYVMLLKPSNRALKSVFAGKLWAHPRQQELGAVAKALDPIRLFHQVEQLQQAVFRCEPHTPAAGQRAPTPSLQMFELGREKTKPLLFEGRGENKGSASLNGDQESQERTPSSSRATLCFASIAHRSQTTKQMSRPTSSVVLSSLKFQASTTKNWRII